MNVDVYDYARLKRELAEALSWDDIVVEGIVDAIFKAKDEDVEEIVLNFMMDSDNGRKVVSNFIAARKRGQVSQRSSRTEQSDTPSASQTRQPRKESKLFDPKRKPPSANQWISSDNDKRVDSRPRQTASTSRERKAVDTTEGGGQRRSVVNMQRTVANCLGCGKIYDSRKQTSELYRFIEYGGICNFCRTPVDISTANGLHPIDQNTSANENGESRPTEMTESERKAVEFKNRLVDYDRNSAQRTTVLDDQSDYFEIETNVWLEEKEKDELRRRRELEDEVTKSLRQKVRYTIDLLGRRVFVSEESKPSEQAQAIADAARVAAESTSAEIPQGGGTAARVASQTAKRLVNSSGESDYQFRVQTNPDIKMTSPIFLPSQAALEHSRTQRQPPPWIQGYKGRLQHDDVFIAFDDDIQPEVLAADLSAYTEFFEQFDNRPFDLCPEDTQRTSLPSISLPKSHPVMSANAKQSAMLVTKETTTKAKKAAMTIPRLNPGEALPDGVVLLKNQISFEEQLRIIESVRNLGIGEGGFYTPIDKYQNRMKIKMMCLGWNWNPIDRLYEKKRSNLDGALAPDIPSFLVDLVQRCKKDADRLRGRPLPSIDPNVCICNYYAQDGALGLHQDEEEGEESLKRQIPVVSFSIGAAAEFVFNRVRSLETAQSILLESGDVLLFGGPSRMLFHGIHKIYPESMPPELAESTGMRVGRLNLTLRQYIP